MLQRVDDIEEVAEGEVAGAAAVMAERALARAQLRLTIVADAFQVVHVPSGTSFRKKRATRRHQRYHRLGTDARRSSGRQAAEFGRACWSERAGRSLLYSVVSVSLHKKTQY